MIKIAFCDDDMEVLHQMNELLDRYRVERNEDITYVAFQSPFELLTEIEKGIRPDILFLDVVMPGQNGMDVAKEIRQYDTNMKIIFLTSSKEFAFDSYEVKALQYLLKPVSPNQLWSIMNDFMVLIKNQKEIFVARTSDGFCKIALEDTNYLEAQNKSVLVFPHNGTSIEIRELFSRCEEIFTLEQGFFRCHRSYIINLNFVNQFTKNSVTMTNGVTLPISRSRSLAFKEAYFTYMFE